jgi:pyruvate/oxaloacetate carboxyltransferase
LKRKLSFSINNSPEGSADQRNQLREVGMEDLLDRILHEIIDVRRELGYPVTATPLSQIVGAQTVDNVIYEPR